jgi:hypothetical protein
MYQMGNSVRYAECGIVEFRKSLWYATIVTTGRIHRRLSPYGRWLFLHLAAANLRLRSPRWTVHAHINSLCVSGWRPGKGTAMKSSNPLSGQQVLGWGVLCIILVVNAPKVISEQEPFLSRSTAISRASPIILSVSPTNNELHVAQGTSLTVTFDQDMDRASINSDSYIVYSRCIGFIAGDISYPDGASATFSPAVQFPAGDLVFGILTTEVGSSMGDTLVQGYVWSFTVEARAAYAFFIPDSSYTVDLAPNALVAADLSGDLMPDLATVNAISFSSLVNHGDGTFENATDYGVVQTGVGIDTGDLDRDGDIDITAISTGAVQLGPLEVFRNEATGFMFDTAYGIEGHPRDVCLADLDQDGDIDAAVTGLWCWVWVFLNDGTGAFPIVNQYATGCGSWSITAGDVNNDGALDLATAGNVDVSILINDGQGNFPGVDTYPTTNCVHLADLDGDGYLDFATADGGDRVNIYLNDGSGGFYWRQSHIVGSNPNSVIAADLDGDGDLDLAATDGRDDTVAMMLNDGDGWFAPPLSFPVGKPELTDLYANDFDGDGDIDLAITSATGGNCVTVLFSQEAPVIDSENSFAFSASQTPASVFTKPSGGGQPLYSCYGPGGMDDNNATITVELRDADNLPIPYYPKELVWLETQDGGLVFCPGKKPVADHSVIAGVTHFSQAYCGSGASNYPDEKCIVVTDQCKINGTPPGGYPENSNMDIYFNSPDINRDMVVNLSDVIELAQDYYMGIGYKSDFYWDGFVNLSDVVKFAQSWMDACP